jgi:hypothetical protein
MYNLMRIPLVTFAKIILFEKKIEGSVLTKSRKTDILNDFSDRTQTF